MIILQKKEIWRTRKLKVESRPIVFTTGHRKWHGQQIPLPDIQMFYAYQEQVYNIGQTKEPFSLPSRDYMVMGIGPHMGAELLCL